MFMVNRIILTGESYGAPCGDAAVLRGFARFARRRAINRSVRKKRVTDIRSAIIRDIGSSGYPLRGNPWLPPQANVRSVTHSKNPLRFVTYSRAFIRCALIREICKGGYPLRSNP